MKFKQKDLKFIECLADFVKSSENNTNKNMGLIILNELLKPFKQDSDCILKELVNSEIRYLIYEKGDESVLPINKDNFEEVVKLLRENADYLWD
jgi:predicted ATP-dependent endonuclease of OLD family